MHPQLRRKVLILLAQQAATTPVPPNTTAGPQTISGNPTNFDPYSYYPTIMTGWGTNNVSWIRQLSNTLNQAIFVLSNGQLDLNKLRGTNFVVDVSKYPDRVLRSIVQFTLQVYRFIFTNLTGPFKTAVNNKVQIIQTLKGFLSTYQIPDGGINPFLSNRIGGPFKTVVINTLTQIK